MQGQYAEGFIPYEIGDKILLKGNSSFNIIDNIRFIQYVKEQKAEFEVFIDGNWISSNLIEKRLEN